jgi:hypothetical protein
VDVASADLQDRRLGLDQQAERLAGEVDRRVEIAGMVASVEDFCRRVRAVLDGATFAQRRQLVELLIDRVVVADGDVEIRYVIPTSPRSESIEEGRGVFQQVALRPQHAVLRPEPAQLLALGRRQPVAAPAVVQVGLPHPVADRLGRAARVARQLLRGPPARPDDAPRLGPELRRVRRRTLRHVDSLRDLPAPIFRCPPSRLWRHLGEEVARDVVESSGGAGCSGR